MATDDLIARVDSLEARNNQLKTLTIAALVLAIVAPLAVAWGAVAYVESITPTLSLEVKELRAQRYVVVNAERRSRGTLHADGNGAELSLGTETSGRVALRAHEDRAAIALTAPEGGAQTALWARHGVAQARMHDGAGHEVLTGVFSSGDESWRAGLRVSGGALGTRVEADGATTGLVSSYRNAEADTSLGARLEVDVATGSGVELVTQTGDVRYRHAELTAPSVDARSGTALRLSQRGSSLTARIGGIPHVDLRRGAESIWSSPTPRGAAVDDEEEAAPAPPPAPAEAPTPAAAPEPAGSE
jgi:hypothetical protein